MKILSILLIFFSLSINAEDTDGKILELREGDVILISLNCYSCGVIEAETGHPYSHSAVVVEAKEEKVYLAQALGSVHLIHLDDFLAKRRPGTTAKVMRPIEFELIFRSGKERMGLLKEGIKYFYYHFYEGLPFDSHYLWNNFDGEGRELLYCSEFVAKFLNELLVKKIDPKPMSYTRNLSYWNSYFSSDVPQGLPGISPSDFLTSELFFEVFDL